MKNTSRIFIIFNPNSTGSSEKNATELCNNLKAQSFRAELYPTKYAGHAEELAYEICTTNHYPLIISASGDGGYHEVVNGVMKALKEGFKAIAAVLPSGNANDHGRTLQDRPLYDAIVEGKPRTIDLLHVQISARGIWKERYAHSYTGLGLTPVVATELNKQHLNIVKEAGILAKSFFVHRPVIIKHHGKKLVLDSIIFANIHQMAKVLTFGPKSKIDDGKFEIISFPHKNLAHLLGKFTRAAASQVPPNSHAKLYEFTTMHKCLMQLDGEVMEIPKGARVRIEVAGKALSTIY